MKRPFETVGALLVGLLVYIGLLAVYHAVTGRPVSLQYGYAGIAAFLVGAATARNIWK